jgi:hypothetical protein
MEAQEIAFAYVAAGLLLYAGGSVYDWLDGEDLKVKHLYWMPFIVAAWPILAVLLLDRLCGLVSEKTLIRGRKRKRA